MVSRWFDIMPALGADGNIKREVQVFLTDREARGYSENTLQFYRQELGYLADYLESQGVVEVLRITADHLRGYLLYLSNERGRNAGGVHCAFRVVRTSLRWYASEYEPDGWRNPITKVRPPKLKTAPIAGAPSDDLHRLLAACTGANGARDRAIIQTLADTGLRASELCSLTLGDFDPKAGTLRTREGKGGKPRTAYLSRQGIGTVAGYLYN